MLEMADSTDASSFDPEAVLDPGQGSSSTYYGSYGPQQYVGERMTSPVVFGAMPDPNSREAYAMRYGRLPPRHQPSMMPYSFQQPSLMPDAAFQQSAGLARPSALSLAGDDSTQSTYDSSGIAKPFSPDDGTSIISGMAAPGSPFLQPSYDAAQGIMTNTLHHTQGTFAPSNTAPPGSPYLNAPPGMVPQSLYPMSAPFGPGHPMAMQGSHPHMPAFHPSMGMLGSPQRMLSAKRTVYVGNLPAEASVDELLNLVKFGPIENVRVFPEKSCAFLSFLDHHMAAAFHADASVKRLSLHSQELRIGWGKPSSCPNPILHAAQHSGATRNVYLGQLDADVTEQSLRDDLSHFGPIDQVKTVRDKNIGFVHFLSISAAMKVVVELPLEPAWEGKRINYGKDRCAYVPKSQQQNQAHNSQAAAMGMAAAASLGYPSMMPPNFVGFPGSASRGQQHPLDHRLQGIAPAFHPMGLSPVTQAGNRTIYLGNIHPDTTTEELCNHVRGGLLQTVRFLAEKHIAFVTFVEASAALAFHHLANVSGIMIHQRRLKVGWGKHSGPLNPALALSVQAGASRNVYIGNIEDFAFHSVEKLRRDFSEYGETELINTLKEKNCAFVNFCNIQNAIKAIEAMKRHPDYQSQRIGAGKDRCGNPPRVPAGPALPGSHASEFSPSLATTAASNLKSNVATPTFADERQEPEAGGLGAIVAQAET